MKKIPIIIDCDTGIDDALALVLALSSEKLDILGITTVAGNVNCDFTTRNTCNVVHLLGRDDIKIAKGSMKPLTRDIFCASGVHGLTGLRGWNFKDDYKENLLDISAVDFLHRTLMAADEKVTLAVLGPMTNVALLLNSFPEVKEKIEKIVFMGTSYHTGNPTPLATFNVLVDPEAFRICLFSGVPFYSCPLNLTRTAVIMPEYLELLKQEKSIVADFVCSIMGNYGLKALASSGEVISGSNEEIISDARLKSAEAEGITMHDPATIGYIIAPELYSVNKYYCDVECNGELTTGFTFIDKEDYYHKTEEERNLFFMESVDVKGFVSLFIDSVRKYSI